MKTLSEMIPQLKRKRLSQCESMCFNGFSTGEISTKGLLYERSNIFSFPFEQVLYTYANMCVMLGSTVFAATLTAKSVVLSDKNH